MYQVKKIQFTWTGCVRKHDDNAETKNEVNHLEHFSSPSTIPFDKIKNADTTTIIKDKIYAIILHLWY